MHPACGREVPSRGAAEGRFDVTAPLGSHPCNLWIAQPHPSPLVAQSFPERTSRTYLRPWAAKNSRCRRSSSGIEKSTATRLGNAIRPFSVSATSQIRCSDPVAPM
jgi:hypothetical protein